MGNLKKKITNEIKLENMKKSFIQAVVNPENSTNPLLLTIINFISAICGILCVFFCAKANISNFVFATVNTIVYAIFLWYHKIFGTFALEVLFYLPINFISWYIWARHRDEKLLEKTKSKKLTVVENILVTLAIVLGGIGYHAILVRIGGNVAWLDAFTLSIGIIAVILEMFRFKEQYIWWIITDVIAVAMYIVHFDPVYLTKKTIYLIMAVIGLINWHKLNKERNKTNE